MNSVDGSGNEWQKGGKKERGEGKVKKVKERRRDDPEKAAAKVERRWKDTSPEADLAIGLTVLRRRCQLSSRDRFNWQTALSTYPLMARRGFLRDCPRETRMLATIFTHFAI